MITWSFGGFQRSWKSKKGQTWNESDIYMYLSYQLPSPNYSKKKEEKKDPNPTAKERRFILWLSVISVSVCIFLVQSYNLIQNVICKKCECLEGWNKNMKTQSLLTSVLYLHIQGLFSTQLGPISKWSGRKKRSDMKYMSDFRMSCLPPISPMFYFLFWEDFKLRCEWPIRAKEHRN